MIHVHRNRPLQRQLCPQYDSRPCYTAYAADDSSSHHRTSWYTSEETETRLQILQSKYRMRIPSVSNITNSCVDSFALRQELTKHVVQDLVNLIVEYRGRDPALCVLQTKRPFRAEPLGWLKLSVPPFWEQKRQELLGELHDYLQKPSSGSSGLLDDVFDFRYAGITHRVVTSFDQFVWASCLENQSSCSHEVFYFLSDLLDLINLE